MTFAARTAALLRIHKLARLATAELVDLYRAGGLEPEHAWSVLKGARKYLDAIAKGDIRGEAAAVAFVETCVRCPMRTTREAEGLVGHYCGRALEDHMEGVLPTCGCCVGITVNGEIRPAGKALVAGEKCPQGRR